MTDEMHQHVIHSVTEDDVWFFDTAYSIELSGSNPDSYGNRHFIVRSFSELEVADNVVRRKA